MRDKIINKCPISGFNLTTHPDWTDVTFAPGHSISYEIIDKNILLCKSVGSASIESLKEILNLSGRIINENFENKPFVYMEDFSKVKSISVEGRKYYMEFLKGLKEMKALVYYNVNPFLSLSIKLAQKLNIFKFDVFVAKNYSNAIDLAFNVLYKKKKNLIIKTEHNVKTSPDWGLKFEGFSIRFEIVNNNIFHIIPDGIIRLEYLDAVFESQHKLIKENLPDKIGRYYYVLDFKKTSITRECRLAYLKKIQSLYDRFPFISYVYYGASRLLNIAIVFSTPFINFDVKKVDNIKNVLEFGERKKKIKTKKSRFFKKKKNSDETQEYIDEFLVFLGKIDWENDSSENTLKKDITHPFYQVYDAITLIKSDLDDLYLERKKNEEERSILQHKLQQSLKLETMGKLAGSVAHDLNNVLSGIVSYPDIILKELPKDKDNDKAVKYIKRMKKSGQKAADIVQDLLTLSRSSILNFESINLNSIISEYLESPELTKLKAVNPNIIIECNLEDDLNSINGSAIHLSKMTMNLVLNAIEAISDKGIVKITTSNKYFNNKTFKNYKSKADGWFIELIISDTGEGISAQDIPKIFEPFYSKKVMGRSGTGLGMLVIKGTIDDHNGFILIDSKEGTGSKFILYFPVYKEKAKIKFIKKVDDYTGKGESILIIDDDEDQRIIAYKILKGLYYSVKTVSSGEKAIELLKQELVDLIILDMIMEPGIGGLETFKQIKKSNPNQKAIIVSGYSSTMHVEEAQRLGAGKYIRKPYTIEDIGIAVYKELLK